MYAIRALRVLRQWFATVPPDVETAIGHADLATVQAVIAHVVTDGIAQVRERMGLHAR